MLKWLLLNALLPALTTSFWFGPETPEPYLGMAEGLKKIYKEKLLPLEKKYNYHAFYADALEDADFELKPQVLLVGQYSTGKTTFIRYLIEQDFPGIRIGPEPTTDKFTAVTHCNLDTVVPGNALVVDAKKPYRKLIKFGTSFLNRFQNSCTNSSVLKHITLLDTPGILSGEKQRLDRGYDFTGVIEWFAERVDRVLLFFDAEKLDISDEFRRAIEALSGHDDKIRIILNKADMDHESLRRVYGALMWNLGKLLKTPEVVRVYVGSFQDKPLKHEINRPLFEKEMQDLLGDLQSLPKYAAHSKLNDLIKRARKAIANAYLISSLKGNMRYFYKDHVKQRLIEDLPKLYEQLQMAHNLSPTDFPDIKKMQIKLAFYDFDMFNYLETSMLETVEKMLQEDLSKLLEQEEATVKDMEEKTISGGAFGGVMDAGSTFFRTGHRLSEKELKECSKMFDQLKSKTLGKILENVAKQEMIKMSKLPNSALQKIWKKSDLDMDDMLDKNEFIQAMQLIKIKLDLPTDHSSSSSIKETDEL